MKPSLVGGVALTIIAVALAGFSRGEQAGSGKLEVKNELRERPVVRPNRSVGFEIQPLLGLGERRALGQASLATRGEPFMRRVTVGGFVRSPGPVASGEGLTLRAAIDQAGGASEFGSMRRVKLIRDGKLRQFDLTDEKVGPVAVEPADTIEVPQKMLIGR